MKIFRSFIESRKVTIIRFGMSVCPSPCLPFSLQGKTLALPVDGFFRKCDISEFFFFEKAVEKIQVYTKEFLDNGATCHSSLVSKKNRRVYILRCMCF
jgi:hypothetical protein